MSKKEMHLYIANRYKDDLPMMVKCHNWQIRNGFPGIEAMDDALKIKARKKVIEVLVAKPEPKSDEE